MSDQTTTLGAEISTMGDVLVLNYQCGCALCSGMREDETNPKGVLPNDASERPENNGGGNLIGANIPIQGELLNLQRNSDGSYFFSGDRNVDATLIGSKWAITNLTYSFPTDGAQYGANYDSGLNNFHIDLGTLQQQAARAGFAMISSYTNLTFTEIEDGANGQQANIRISQTADNDVASAQGLFPSDKLPQAGDSWFGRTSQPFYDLAIRGSWGYSTMLHEIGHTMGLKHGHQDYTNADLSFYFGTPPRFGTRALSPEVDGQAWSLMTYTPAPGASGFAGEKVNQPQTYMQFDIAALQYMYGANYTTNATNTVYTWNATTGEQFVNGVGQGAPSGNKILTTVWDGGGVDTYDLSNYDNGMTVDLRPGAFSAFSVDQLANHTALSSTVNLAPGNIANALLFNNDARSLIENVIGGDGADRITGNSADNVLDGGAGDDRLAGGLGSDLLIGGAGSDTASFADAASGVTVVLNDTGADVLVSHDGETDILRGIENIVGTAGADSLTGNAANNTLEGGTGGADILTGGAGDDRLIGGTFTAGLDPSLSRPDIVKPQTVENETIATAVDTADAFDAQPDPNIANSTTVPHATVRGVANGGGLEYYRIDVAQAGARAVFDIDGTGGAFAFDSFIDLVDANGVVLASNDDAGGDPGSPSGTDSLINYVFTTPGVYYVRVGKWTGPSTPQPLDAGQSYTLNISLTSAPVPILVNNTSSATLIGGDGNDFLQGTVGNDLYDGGAGTDTASFATAYSPTSAGVTVSLAVAGPQATGAAGTDTLVGIENLVGSQYNDTLTGSTGANVMEGGLGDDTMDGAVGFDTASYAGAASAVTVSLAAQGAAQATGGAGSDTLINFENLLGSAFNDTLSGNAAANLVTGGAGDDVLNGNATGVAITGIDTLDGGLGTDTASFAAYAASVVATLNGAFDAVATVGGANNAVLRGIENLTGGTANDRLTGDAGANVLSGLAGNDDLSGGDGDDRLDGGLGDDILSGGSGSDTAMFSGTTAVIVDLRLSGAQNTGMGLDTLIGIENLVGGSGNDTLIGNDGDNVFTDTGGADSYIGNGGSDTVSYASAASGISVDLKTVTALTSAAGAAAGDTLLGIENLVGTAFGDNLTGNAGNNVLDGGAGAGIDILQGDAGNDTLSGGAGNDALFGDLNNFLSAADGADVLEGGLGADVLVGGLGNDILRGGDGDDSLVNGVGATNIFGQLTTVYVNDGGDDVFDGGEGSDIAYAYYTGRAGAVSFDLGNIAGNSTITVGGVEAGGFISVERVIFRGGLGGDVVRGGGTLDTLVGNEGDDVLDGWFGNDSLQGNAGNDTLIGGEGLDTATFVNSTANITVDLRITTAQDTGEGLDTFREIEYLQGGAGSDTFNGTDDFNLIADVTGGNDSFYGHGGNDTLTITRAATVTAANTLLLDGGAGHDIIQLNSGTVSPAPAPNAIGLSSGVGREVTALGATGTRYLDTVTVNAGEGDDRVVLTALNTATVDLGTGADIVSLSLLGTAAQSIHTVTLGAGSDTIQFAVSATAANNVAASTTARSNVVTDFQVGNSGDRFELTAFLNGSLVGYTAATNPFASGHLRLLQSGPDMLLQVDRDAGAGANGFVTLFTLRNTATGGFTAFNFDGFATAVFLTGTAGADTLTGGELADTLVGSDGDDTLIGLGGADTLIGGFGDDIYVVEGADVIREFAGQGDDEVRTANASYTLADNVERLTGTSATGQTLTGNGLNNLIAGGTGADTLNGADGNDILMGGEGADQLNGGTGSDAVSYMTATRGMIIDLSAQAANDGDTFSSIENAIGSAFDDIFFGSEEDNVFEGGLGADQINGYGGSDTVSYVTSSRGMIVDLGAQAADDGDTFSSIENAIGSAFDDIFFGSEGDNVFEGGAGADRINGFGGSDTAVYSNSASGVRIDLTAGTASDGDILLEVENVIGSNFADVLVGGAGANRLDGGAGDDLLQGGSGADLLLGGLGTDTVSYADRTAGIIVDLDVQAANDGDFFSSVENAVGSDFDDIFFGSSGDNVFEGGLGADQINGYGGSDTVSYANTQSAVVIDLIAQRVTGGDGDVLSGIENAIGSAFDDTVVGDDGDNLMEGGLGADKLYGFGGVDTVSYAGSARGMIVDLGAQAADDGDTFIGVENMIGSAFADTVFGGEGANTMNGGAGDDALNGFGGADVLIGGLGRDVLSGGADGDRFVFNSLADSTVTASDRITDFDSALDLIDLSAIDANSVDGGDQAFTFASAFSGVAGQAVLSYNASTNITALTLDVDGDSVADFRLEITGNVGSGSGFVL